MLIFDTIAALSTPPYKSALAIVRLSGPKAEEILLHLIKKKKENLIPNQSFFARLYKDEEHTQLIDEAMVTFYRAPKSYTGFDSVDFCLHGSMFIVDELLDTLVKYGARRAQRGEFSAQAYYNQKMDLLKAEGINDLINANSKRAKEIATSTLSGKNSLITRDLKISLLDIIAELEYYVEDQYSDEKDDYDDELEKENSKLKEKIAFLDKTIQKTEAANREYRGVIVTIAGEPNVGKSTLLNALVESDKAIVSPVPGTTRDVVEGQKEIKGVLFTFKDTAGIRKTDDLVENLGIERSYKTIKEADIVLLTSDSGFAAIDNNQELQSLLKDKPTIKVATKKDLGRLNEDSDIYLSALQDDLTPLIELIFDKLNLSDREEADFLGEREEDYLKRINNALKEASFAIDETKMIDIVSDKIRNAVSLINEMAGEDTNKTMEDIYETLFSKFCLGK